MKKVVILINAISKNAGPDELDVLDQACLIESALDELSYNHQRLFVDLNLERTSERLKAIKPCFVVNLVESLQNDAKLIHLIPSLLEHLKIPFTGCSTNAIFISTYKTLTNKLLKSAGLPVPHQLISLKKDKFISNIKYIAKPICEDASVGISDENIIEGSEISAKAFLDKHAEMEFFFEEYIEGREFNISVLASKSGPEVLPIPEIIFNNFPKEKPKIIGYDAKWNEQSFEYKNTFREFGLESADAELAANLKNICLDCWEVLGLRGYARVDIRVDKKGKIYIIEVNANPCLSEDAGFYAASKKAGYSFTEVFQRIIKDK